MNELFGFLARYTRWGMDHRVVQPTRDAAFVQWAQLETDKYCPLPFWTEGRNGGFPENELGDRLSRRETFLAHLEQDYDAEHGLMATQVTDVVVADDKGTWPRYSLSISDEPAGSPKEKKWKGSFLKFNGISRADLIGIMKRVTARLEAGEELWEISRP